MHTVAEHNGLAVMSISNFSVDIVNSGVKCWKLPDCCGQGETVIETAPATTPSKQNVQDDGKTLYDYATAVLFPKNRLSGASEPTAVAQSYNVLPSSCSFASKVLWHPLAATATSGASRTRVLTRGHKGMSVMS